MRTGIQSAMIGLLTAVPKTPLHTRLALAGRLRADGGYTDNTKLATNVIPARMTYDELMDGYRALYSRLLEDRNIAARIRVKLGAFGASTYAMTYSPSELLAMTARLVVRGLLPGGPSRLFHFVRSMNLRRPRLLPLVLHQWIIALAMRDYVRRHLILPPQPGRSPAQRPLPQTKGAASWNSRSNDSRSTARHASASQAAAGNF
jgi:hypothetical protein